MSEKLLVNLWRWFFRRVHLARWIRVHGHRQAPKVLACGCGKDKLPLLGVYSMRKLKAEDKLREVECPACNGTGLPKVKQPIEPGRRIFPAPCSWCLGKGRLATKLK
jgi:hypothetical protein